MATEAPMVLLCILFNCFNTAISFNANPVTTLRNGEYSVQQNKVIIDISSIRHNLSSADNSTLENLLTFADNGDDGSSEVVIYYETDLDNRTVQEITILTDWIGRHYVGKHVPEIMLTLKYNVTELKDMTPWLPNSIVIPRDSLPILQQLDSLLPKLEIKVAFEDTKADYTCVEKERRRAWPFNAFIDAEKLHFMLSCANCTGKLKVGYSVKYEVFGCPYFVMKNLYAHFFVVKLKFENMHTNFVESFGVFKRRMDSVREITEAQLLKMKHYDLNLTFYHFQTSIDTKSDDVVVSPLRKHSAALFLNVKTNQVDNLVTRKQQNDFRELMVDRKYRCLFKQFLSEWISANNVSIITQASDYKENCSSLYLSSQMAMLIPDPLNVEVYLGNDNRNRKTSCNMLRAIQVTLEDMRSQGFRNIEAYSGLWRNLDLYLRAVGSDCRKILSSNKNVSNDDATDLISVNISPDDLNKTRALDTYLSSKNYNAADDIKSILGMRVNKYAIDLDYYRLPDIPTLGNKTELSCTLVLGYIHAYLEDEPNDSRGYVLSRHIIDYLWNKSDILEHCDFFILKAYLLTDTRNMYRHASPIDRDGITTNLKRRFLLAKSLIQMRWPNKGVALSVDTVTRFDEIEAPLYCDPALGALSEYNEAIITWATIYNISVLFGTQRLNPISFEYLQSDDAVLPKIYEKFPLFLRRSFNQSKALGEWTNGMYPCLQWLREISVQDKENGFSKNQIGTYFRLHLRLDGKISRHAEISNLLLFSLAHLRVTEIEISNYNELVDIVEVLKHPEFRHKLQNNSVAKRQVYLSIPITVLQEDEHRLASVLKKTSALSSHHEDIHFKIHLSKLSTSDIEGVAILVRKILQQQAAHNNKTEIGIELDNCAKFVEQLSNEQLETGYHRTVEKLSYVVCTIPARLETGPSKTDMQKFLETHFYIKRFLKYFFPNLNHVYFKMLPSSRKTDSEDAIKELLILFDHINNFARGYEMSYFLLPAFLPENSSQNGWFEISNYSDLSDPNVFRDIQSSYLKTKPWRPMILKPDDIPQNDEDKNEEGVSTPWLVYGLLGSLGFLTVILIAVATKARRNAKLLSDQDVQDFINGRGSLDSNDYNSRVVTGEYATKFEILKGDICLDLKNILGMGNFGVVYKASISPGVRSITEEIVAVKMPRIGCDKQAFVGMLREIKLLCHLGNHGNLVEFIGCYTKEIQKGIVYVVMELCEGGNLLTHLRNLKSNEARINADVMKADLNQFCKEIASGMEYISGRNVIHGDLSARNVLLDRLKICKISDFGLSKKLYQCPTYVKKNEEPLPWRWMAYETLESLEFSVKSDVWSFSVTAWEVYSLGKVPYSGHAWSSDFIKNLKQGMRLTLPEYATADIYELLEKCWKLEPEERPDFTELVGLFAKCLPYADII